MIRNPEKLLLECLMKRQAISTKNEVIYTAGYTGYDFFELSKLTLSPETSEKVVDMYLSLLQEVERADIEYNKLAFINRTIGSMSIASWLSHKVGKEIVVVDVTIPCRCNLCTKLRVRGSVDPPLHEGDKVVVVSDVITSGGTVLNAIDIIEKNKAKVVGVITILDRQTRIRGKTAKERIEERGIRVFSFITRDRLLALGFIEQPSMDDLRNKDYFSLLKKAIFIKYGKNELGKNLEEIIESNKNFIDIIVTNILESKNIEPNEENKRTLRNMFLSLVMQARCKTLIGNRGKSNVIEQAEI